MTSALHDCMATAGFSTTRPPSTMEPLGPSRTGLAEMSNRKERESKRLRQRSSRQLVSVLGIRENQTCTKLRATISSHLLPPISWWADTVDSYRRSCRNSRASHRKGGFSGTGKRPLPLREKGGGAKATQNGNHDLVNVRSSLKSVCWG